MKIIVLIIILLLLILIFRSENFYSYGKPDTSVPNISTPGAVRIIPGYHGGANDVDDIPINTFIYSLDKYKFRIYGHNMISDSVTISIPPGVENLHGYVFEIYPGDEVRESDFYSIYQESPMAFFANTGKYLLSGQFVGPGVHKIDLRDEPRRIAILFMKVN